MGSKKLDIHNQSFFNYLESLGHLGECALEGNNNEDCTCHYQISRDMHNLLLEAATGRGVEASRKFEDKYPWLFKFNY